MIGAVVRGRTVTSLTPFRCAPFASQREAETMWGVVVVYVMRGKRRGISNKTFYNVDELGAFMAFEKHCKALDEALFRRRERSYPARVT